MNDDAWSCYDGCEDFVNDAVTHPNMPALRDRLRKMSSVGRGAQGAIYKALYRGGAASEAFQDYCRQRGLSVDETEVIVKRLFVHHHITTQLGRPISHVREVSTLRVLNHPNIVKLFDVVEAPHHEPCLVLEAIATDLESLVIKGGVRLTGAHLKYVVKSLLTAVDYLGSMGVLHRDIKPSNVGVARDGTIKLLDFGSARPIAPFRDARYSPVSTCTTLVFSPPELLLGSRQHTTAVDVWGVGVMMAEMARGRHTFDARSQIEMLSRVFSLVGTPSESDWPAMAELPACATFKFSSQPSTLVETFVGSGSAFKYISATGVDLLQKLMHPSPDARITASAALEHPWLTSESPLPCTAAEFAPLLSAAPAARTSQRASSVPSAANGRQIAMAILAGMDDDDDDDDDTGDAFGDPGFYRGGSILTSP